MRRLLAFAVVGFVVLMAVPVSAAGTVGAVGWWTRSPIASAPEGGVSIGNAPDGPLSVAAVEVDLGADGVSSATLSLEQAGGTAPSPGQLVACIIGGGFAADPGAPIEDAPATTCDATQAPVAVNGTTWTVNVGALVGEKKGTVGIALVPATASPSVWDLQLEAPTFTATARTAGGGGPSSGPSPFRTATTAAPARTSPAAAPQTFAVAKPPTVATPTASTVVPATTTTTVAAETAVGQATFTGQPASASHEGRPVGQAVTMVVIAVIVGIGAGVAHRMAARRIPA